MVMVVVVVEIGHGLGFECIFVVVCGGDPMMKIVNGKRIKMSCQRI